MTRSMTQNTLHDHIHDRVVPRVRGTVRRPAWPGPDLEPSGKPYCPLLAPSKTKHRNRKDWISDPYWNWDTARAPALRQLAPTVRMYYASEMT